MYFVFPAVLLSATIKVTDLKLCAIARAIWITYPDAEQIIRTE